MNKGFPAAQIDLDRLQAGPVEWSGDLPAEKQAWGLDELDLVDRPNLRYRAEMSGVAGVRVRGALKATLNLSCRRCLSALTHAVDLDLDLRFEPAVRPWEEEEGLYGLDPEWRILDLTEALREEMRLAVPEYPECAEGCRGMCPQCGADLLEDECGCAGGEADPRWDVLRKLMSDSRTGVAEPADGEEG